MVGFWLSLGAPMLETYTLMKRSEKETLGSMNATKFINLALEMPRLRMSAFVRRIQDGTQIKESDSRSLGAPARNSHSHIGK